MATPLARPLALGALTALLPLALACDDADPDGGPDPVQPVAVDTGALAETFACDVAAFAVGEGMEGDLADATCALDDGRAVAYYAFGVDALDTFVVGVGSAWFDAVAYLYDGDGDLLVENDDASPWDTNPRFITDLERGVYVLGVTSFEPEAAGSYRVAVNR